MSRNSVMKSNLPIFFILLLGISSGNAWANEPSSPDCSTAEDDISKLEQGKKSEGRGLLSYTPVGMVVNAAKDSDEKDKKKEEAEAHNSKINDQIEAIKQACNIQ